jgi:hypothetical protein
VENSEEEEEIEMTAEEAAYLLKKVELSLETARKREVYTEEEVDKIILKW